MSSELAHDRDRVGPYLLLKAIGAGGSARIDLARIDRAYGFQRHVVIKRPLEHLRGDSKAAASLRREARLGGMLRHPNLVGILDAGVHEGYDYLVLEYVHGASLRGLMQTDTAARVAGVGLGVALAIVGEVARGLHHAHELADDTGAPLGLVHRDVSPGNVLIDLDGSVKLADFGIAKETRVATLSGSMHGTVTYMAPEQCRGHAFDRRADVFSLGVILYELVTGTRLFWADNDVASLHRVLSGNVPRPRKLRPALAVELEEIVMTAVAHDQDRRFASTRDLAEALESYASEAGETLGARHVARWVHDILGPRDQPWIGATTIPDVEQALAAPRATSEADASLVELIATIPEEGEEPLPTFGPAGFGEDQIDTEPRRDPPVHVAPRKRRKLFAGVIAIGLAGGAAATAFVMSREAGPGTAKPPVGSAVAAPQDRASSPTTPTVPVAADGVTDPVIEPTIDDAIELATDPGPATDQPGSATPRAPTRRKRPPPTGSATTDPAPLEIAQPTTPDPAPGSAAQGSARPKIEWSPGMLLPTDQGSGTK